MKDVYESAYKTLVENCINRSKFPGCHKHRITPGYKGGKYTKDNVLFVTQREHCLLHFILWKLNNDTRDKRAYKMIGVGPNGLSRQDRIDHGLLAKQNKLGFHSATADQRLQWSLKGLETQKKQCVEMGVKNFYYWSSELGRKERASLGGKASYPNNIKFKQQSGSFKDKNYAAKCNSLSAKKPVTDGRRIIKFHEEKQREQFLKENVTWRKGYPTKKEKSALETSSIS